MYREDNRTVVTLDAGGTNFVFGAIRANKFIVDPITMPSHADDLDRCLATKVEGFDRVKAQHDAKPSAISFAFPGPADYPNGIIGGHLPNFPSFRDGVALGPFLEDKFGIPVYINNDADLYAYGEALAGALPDSTSVWPLRAATNATAICWATPSARDSDSDSSPTASCTWATTRAWRPSASSINTCPT